MPLGDEQPKPHVDPSVTDECGELVDVPHRFVPADEASRLWARDRANFGDCRRLNHAKAVTIKVLIR
jgi:hypothetical protein